VRRRDQGDDEVLILLSPEGEAHLRTHRPKLTPEPAVAG
jgi:hypothetical protein